MKILVTGGAEFIGSFVIRNIIKNTQDSVVNLDKLTYAGNLINLLIASEISRNAFEQTDIYNAVELQRIFTAHQPYMIMHLAAESQVRRSIDGPSEFIKINILSTYNLLKSAQFFKAIE